MSEEVLFFVCVFTSQALYQFQYVKNSRPGNEAAGNIRQTDERSLSYFDENPAAGREPQPSFCNSGTQWEDSWIQDSFSNS